MLAETIIALLVTTLILGILQQSLKIVKNVPDNLNANQIRWHMTNEYIQNQFQGEFLKDKKSKKLIFDDKNKIGGAHILEFYQNMLRVRSEEGGHVPLITGLKSGSFKVDGDVIVIRIVNKKNQISEMYVTNDHQSFEK